MVTLMKGAFAEQLPLPHIFPENEYQEKGFTNHLEYLQWLEWEAKIRLIYALAKKNGDGADQPKVKENLQDRFYGEESCLEIDRYLSWHSLEGKSKMNLRILVEKAAEENKRKAEKSLLQGIEAPFENLCRSFRLEPFERCVVLLLFAKRNWKGIQALIEKHGPSHWKSPHGRMRIQALVEILADDPQEQMTYWKYFNSTATLIHEGIVIFPNDYGETGNFLDTEVCLHERIFRHILGGPNGYGPFFRSISRERKPIEIDRVILREDIKQEVLRLAENYLRHKSEMKRLGIHEFYGYGRGLTFLFHGPSGTGKTMFAHALAHHLKVDLFSLNMDDHPPHEISILEAIQNIYKEARLSNGIVFFDECNHLFEAGTYRSRALLLEIEKADCITILATNKPDDLDPALDRRVNLQVPFHLPDECQREKIWKALIPPEIEIRGTLDFQKLAKDFALTGGLIKNAIYMAIQNGISQNGHSAIFLEQKEMERAATAQLIGLLRQKEIETVYRPQIRMEDLGIREEDEEMLLRAAMMYEEYNGRGFGLNIVIGSSDIETGIGCAEAVARELDLAVRKFPFSNLFTERFSIRKKSFYAIERDIHMLDRAFKINPGQKELLVFVDPDSLFEKLIGQGANHRPVKEFEDFLEKLGAFQGMVFMVTRPIRNQMLPIEFHSYLEIQYPLKEVQIQR